MSKSILINGQSFRAIAEIADSVLYSRDYVTRLAREHKIKAVQLNRRWYIQPDSLKAYTVVQQQEQQVRQKHLRLERLAEQKVTQAKKHSVQLKTTSHERFAVVAVAGILFLGSILGSQILNLAAAPNSATAITMTGFTIDTIRETESSIPSQALEPNFSESSKEVFVSTGRSFDLLVDIEMWRLIQHE